MSKNYKNALVSGKIGTGAISMEERKKDAWRDVVITDIDSLVPEDHLPRKTEKSRSFVYIRNRFSYLMPV